MPILTFKVTADEARLIRARAKQSHISVSEYLRRQARLPPPVPRQPETVRCAHTGAMIFAAPGDQAPLTTTAVREMLSDFP